MLSNLRQTAFWQRMANLPFLRNFTLNLGLACFVLAFCVLSDGFDLSLYNQIQAMKRKPMLSIPSMGSELVTCFNPCLRSRGLLLIISGSLTLSIR